MNFEIDKSLFLSSIQKVQAVVDRRNTVPILSNVRIKVDAGQMEVIATDLEVGLRDLVEVQVNDPGSITVSAKVLYEVLKELPNDIIHFNVEENNWIRLTCGYAEFKLVGTSDEDYPRLPEFEEDELVSVSGELLDELTKKTVYAVSHDENRHVLNGVLFKIDSKNICMVATDGHRLAYIEKKNEESLKEMQIILPQKGIHEIQRMVSSGKDELKFGISGNHIIFKLENEIVIARLVDGQFPNYTKVIPDEIHFEIKIGKESIYNSLRRVALFADLKARGVKFQINEGVMQINASTPEYGEAKDELMVEYSGEPITVGFNVNYLLDLLRIMDSEDILIQVKDPSGPVIFRPVEQKEYEYISIVMPMII